MEKNFWDERFESDTYVYGKDANVFLKKSLEGLNPGKILFPGEGEGRNAVFAAEKGWEVFAFDSSIEGQKKALNLAKSRGVSIDYQLSNYLDFSTKDRFDAIGLFFTHMPAEMRPRVHDSYVDHLNPGGRIILQGFRKEQFGLTSGGPKDLTMLFSKEELKHDFKRLSSIDMSEVEEVLSEGPFHQGFAHLITLTGIK